MFFLRRSLIGVLLMALALGGLAWAGASVYRAVSLMLAEEPGVRPNREVAQAVDLTVVRLGTETPVLETFGEIRSRRTLDVRAALAGRIIALSERFIEGGRIEADALLARIDPAEAEADVALAQADLTEAEADLADARLGVDLAQADLAVSREQAELQAQSLGRQQDLQARGVGSNAAVETAALASAGARQSVVSRRQALAQAEARVQQESARRQRSEIALSEARRRLRDTEIRARFGGVLSDVSVVEGGLVSANEQLARLVDPGALEVAFRLSTAQYARLLDESGSLRDARVDVVLETDGLSAVAQGSVARESAVVGAGQTGREVFARLEDPVGLRPGDIVSVRITESPLPDVARVPARAVDSAGNVLVLTGDMRLREAPVRLLRRQGDDVIVAAPDLAGERIVSARTPLLGAGLKVRPIDEGAALDGDPEGEPTVLLSPERREQLIDFVRTAPQFDPDARARVLALLARAAVPADIVARVEARMGS